MKVGGGVAAGFQSVRGERRGKERASRAFALAASDMDQADRALGVAKRAEHGGGAGQAETGRVIARERIANEAAIVIGAFPELRDRPAKLRLVTHSMLSGGIKSIKCSRRCAVRRRSAFARVHSSPSRRNSSGSSPPSKPSTTSSKVDAASR